MLLALMLYVGGFQGAVPVCDPDYSVWPADQDILLWVSCVSGGSFGSDCIELDAGPDIDGFTNSTITLNGTQVTVPQEPEAVVFSWTQIPNGAPVVTINDADTATPNFLPTAAVTYEFEVTATWHCRVAIDRILVVVDVLQGPPDALDATEIVTFSSDTAVQVTFSNPGDDRLFIVLKSGRIVIYKDGALLPDPFLNISALVSTGSEQGLLGMAFDPDYETNGFFYVNYTGRNPDGTGSLQDTRIVAYQRDAVNPDLADPSQNAVLMSIDQPFSNHNAGMLAFGADGHLYIGTGDGGSGGDPQNNSQNPQALLGKMLRIAVDGLNPYTIPADNPFVGDPTTLDEIWALGLRNPWKYSFDRTTGDLYIADVGQNQWEEINFQAASSAGGENYGWRLKEGSQCFNPPTNCDPGGLTDPVWEYEHASGRCSITGGYVYRGQDIPLLSGFYMFGDFCSGEYWLLRDDGGWNASLVDIWADGVLLTNSDDVTAFGEDARGELYVIPRRFGEAAIYKIIGVHTTE